MLDFSLTTSRLFVTGSTETAAELLVFIDVLESLVPTLSKIWPNENESAGATPCAQTCSPPPPESK